MSEPIPPTPEEVQAAETIIDAAQQHETRDAPADTWLLHYGGVEPLTKGDYTWQPGQTLPVPEALARTLFGQDNLRVVQDPDLAHALADRAG